MARPRRGGGAAALHGFDQPVAGPDGFTMPATQHDAVLWLAGAPTTSSSTWLAPPSRRWRRWPRWPETSSWPYRHDRDLTGFVDGTENPSLARAPDVALVPPGTPGAGGRCCCCSAGHTTRRLGGAGRRCPGSGDGPHQGRLVELADKPATSHVARTDQDDFGDIFRRNMPYGTVTAHGTMFVGFAAEQGPLARMLDSMAGLTGPRDELTRYTTPETGGYYFVPALVGLRGFATADDDQP